MEVYAVKSVNYKQRSDTAILKIFQSFEKAKEFALKDVERVNGSDITWKSKDDNEPYQYRPDRYEYTSQWGSYPCAREIEIWNVE